MGYGVLRMHHREKLWNRLWDGHVAISHGWVMTHVWMSHIHTGMVYIWDMTHDISYHIWDMTHDHLISYMGHDSWPSHMIYGTWLMTISYHMWDMTHDYLIWPLHMRWSCGTCEWVMSHIWTIPVWMWLIHTCVMTHPHVRHNSFVYISRGLLYIFMCETWLMNKWGMCSVSWGLFWKCALLETRAYVWHDSSTCETWLTHIWGMRHVLRCLWYTYEHGVGSIKLQVSFAKEPYKRNDILQKRPIILSIAVDICVNM